MQQTFQSDSADQLVNVSLNNNVLTVAGSLSNIVTSLTIDGQAATVYQTSPVAVAGGDTLANGLNTITAVVTSGGVKLTNIIMEDRRRR